MDGVMKELVQEIVSGEVFGVWFLIGAALVFWMQAGFRLRHALTEQKIQETSL